MYRWIRRCYSFTTLPEALRSMLVVALLLMAPVTGWTAKVLVQWDTNTEPNVVGYKIYLGTQTGAYTFTNDVGTQTLAQAQNLFLKNTRLQE